MADSEGALKSQERNSQKDRDDVKYLARAATLDVETLRQRYQTEQRPYFADGIQSRTDLTMDLWTEMLQELS